jgi:hypothetical protein
MKGCICHLNLWPAMPGTRLQKREAVCMDEENAEPGRRCRAIKARGRALNQRDERARRLRGADHGRS